MAARSATCWCATSSRVRSSRSSTRIKKRRPAERANSHASTAVRRLPMCRSADGLGANLPAVTPAIYLAALPRGGFAHFLVVLGEVALDLVDVVLGQVDAAAGAIHDRA